MALISDVVRLRNHIGVELLVGDEIKRCPQRCQVVVRHRRRTTQRALGNIETLIGMLRLGNRACGFDGDQDRNSFRALGKQAAYKRDIFLGQGNCDQDRVDLLRLQRAPCIRRSKILEGHLVCKIVFRLQHINDVLIDVSPDHTEGAAL